MKTDILVVLWHGALIANSLSLVDAGRANPEPWDTPIGPVKLVGNAESHTYIEVATGYPLVPSKQSDASFVYAVLDDHGDLVASKYPVQGVDPDTVAELRADARPRHTRTNQQPRSRKLDEDDWLYPLRLPLSSSQGTPLVIQNFVLRIRFADHVNHTLPETDAYVKLMNGQNVAGSCDPNDESCSAPTGSMRDFFKEQSYGKLVINSTVSEWVDLPETQAFYAAGCSGTCDAAFTLFDGIIDALIQLDEDNIYDWSEFDTIGGGADGLESNGYVDLFSIITSGYDALVGGNDQYGNSVEDRIWSHQFFLNNNDFSAPPGFTTSSGISFNAYTISPGLYSWGGAQVTHLGILVHETSHTFGLPDFYDSNYLSWGFGEFGLMSDQHGWDNTQNFPPSLSPWCRERLGFLSFTLVTDSSNLTLNEIHTTPQVFKFTHGYPANEYLLVEYRAAVSNEYHQPGSGVLIWKVDENMNVWGSNSAFPYYPGSPNDVATHHYHVALVEADGLYQLQTSEYSYGDAGDIWNVGQELGDLTNPTLNSYELRGCRQNGTGLSGNHISITSYDTATDTFKLTYKAAPSCGCDTQCSLGEKTPTRTPTLSPTLALNQTPTFTPTLTPTSTNSTYIPTMLPTPLPSIIVPGDDESNTDNGTLIGVLVGSCVGVAVFVVLVLMYQRQQNRGAEFSGAVVRSKQSMDGRVSVMSNNPKLEL